MEGKQDKETALKVKKIMIHSKIHELLQSIKTSYSEIVSKQSHPEIEGNDGEEEYEFKTIGKS